MSVQMTETDVLAV